MESNSDNVIAIRQGMSPLMGKMWNFSYPHQVVADDSLSLADKRSILAAWASDMHAVESFPALRHLPGTPFPVTFSSIMNARAALDDGTDRDDDPPPAPHAMRSGRAPISLREAA
jgi:hypothetical protein